MSAGPGIVDVHIHFMSPRAIEEARRRKVSVLLVGMEAPPNWGEVYTRQFHSAFRELADQYQLAFVPFLLEGVAGIANLNQADGLHPTSQGARMIAEHLWPALEKLVRAAGRSGP